MEKYITIGEIIELMKLLKYNQDDLIVALLNCKEGRWKNKAYYQFVSSKNANQVGSDWQFDTNIVLEHPIKGTIVLDILKDNVIGGIEFLDLLD